MSRSDQPSQKYEREELRRDLKSRHIQMIAIATSSASTRAINRRHDVPVTTAYDLRQYSAVRQRKPDALGNGAPSWSCRMHFASSGEYCSSSPAATGRCWSCGTTAPA